MDAASGFAWINRDPWQVSRTDKDGSTQGGILNAVIIVEPPSPVLDGIFGNAEPSGINMIQQVVNKRQYVSPSLVGQPPKLDAVVDVKFPDDLNLLSIFRKEIGDKLSNHLNSDLYMRCRMNLKAYPIQTQTPQFVDMGFLTIDALDDNSGFHTPATIIWRPTDGAHWSTPNNICGEITILGVSKANSDCNYNYKTEFQIWK